MTEIKIRFWTGKDFFIPSYIFGNNYIKNLFEKYKIANLFSRVKDSNGKDIYDGDIVKITHECNNVHIVKVIFENGYFDFAWDNDSNCIKGIHYYVQKYKCEIIGNVYENPDYS